MSPFEKALEPIKEDGPTQQNEHLGLIKVDPFLSSEEWDLFTENLADLKTLGLVPIVVLDMSFARARRVKLIHHLFHLVERMDTHLQVGESGLAIPLYSGIFHVPNTETGGVHVNLSPIRTVLSLGKIPVLLCQASDRNGSMTDNNDTNLSSETCLVALCSALARDESFGMPVRYISINSRAGGLVVHDQHVGFVNLEEDYDTLCAKLLAEASTNSTLQEGPSETAVDLASELTLMKNILSILPSSSSGILTAASSSPTLISNFITNKPIGSFVSSQFSTDLESSISVPTFTSSYGRVSRQKGEIAPATLFRSGMTISHYRSLDAIDIPKLTRLLESSFQKTLNARDFFARLERDLDSIVVAGDYDGAYIVTVESCKHLSQKYLGRQLPGEDMLLPYLDKLAVSPSSQGLGVADILWHWLMVSYPTLTWRSRYNNPINKW